MRRPLTPRSPNSRLQCFDLAQGLRRSQPGCRQKTSPLCECPAPWCVFRCNQGNPEPQSIHSDRHGALRTRRRCPVTATSADLKRAEEGMCSCPVRALKGEPLPWGRQQDRGTQEEPGCQPPLPTMRFASRALLPSNPRGLNWIKPKCLYLLHLQIAYSMNPPGTPASKSKQALLYPITWSRSFCPTTDSFCLCSQHCEDSGVPDGDPAASHETRGATDAVSTGGPTGPGTAGGRQKDAGGEDTPCP